MHRSTDIDAAAAAAASSVVVSWMLPPRGRRPPRRNAWEGESLESQRARILSRGAELPDRRTILEATSLR